MNKQHIKMRSRRIIATFVLHCRFNTFNDNTWGFINRQEIRTKSRLIVTASLLYCIFLQHDIRTYAVPSYHFIILVSITPVRAKITGYKIIGRDHCRICRSRSLAEFTETGRDYSGRYHSGRDREWPRSPCSYWRLDGTGEYQIFAHDKVNVNRPALPSPTIAHTHYRKCHYDYLVIY